LLHWALPLKTHLPALAAAASKSCPAQGSVLGRRVIEMKRRQLLCNPIIIRIDFGQISQVMSRREWKLTSVIQTRIQEPAGAMHFKVATSAFQ
jgi:hypothetical protein